MNVKDASPWLVFLFTLPRAQASGRVDVWRRLKRTGALPLESGGYLLPNSQDNRERFEWLAESVRQYKGTALVLAVNEIGDPNMLNSVFRLNLLLERFSEQFIFAWCFREQEGWRIKLG